MKVTGAPDPLTGPKRFEITCACRAVFTVRLFTDTATCPACHASKDFQALLTAFLYRTPPKWDLRNGRLRRRRT